MTDNRWVVQDPITSETHFLVRNPRTMASALSGEVATDTLDTGDGVIRTLATPKVLEWRFEGRVKSTAEESALRAFLLRKRPLLLTDHFGETYRVLITRCPFTEKPVKRGYRAEYAAAGYVLEGPL